jgi:hypothetical protein
MDYYGIVSSYIQRADMFMKRIIYDIAPIYREENGSYQDVTVPLFTTLHSTSESILIILLHGGLFDADILLRCVMEGTIKYCYLMNGSENEKNDKYIEYKEKLYEISKIADHKKAIEAVMILKEFSENSTTPFELDILDDEMLDNLRKKYPTKLQNEIKSKWSYQKILRSLAETSSEYKAQLGTLASYSMTSHLCHFDWNGVLSRELQILDSTKEDAEVCDIAHGLRILSNVLSMEMFRVVEYLKNSKIKMPKVVELSLEILELISEIDKYENEIVKEKVPEVKK